MSLETGAAHRGPLHIVTMAPFSLLPFHWTLDDSAALPSLENTIIYSGEFTTQTALSQSAGPRVLQSQGPVLIVQQGNTWF